MNVNAEILVNSFIVRQRCSVCIDVRSTDALKAGDRIEAQFPNSWYVLTGPSFTRAVQAEDPSAEHFIQVEAEDRAVRFRTEIKPRHLNFPEGSVRHGRHVIGTLVDRGLPPGALVRILYTNTFAPCIAETEYVWVRVNGEAPQSDPELIVQAGPAVGLRILAPGGVEPGEQFKVLVVSLDQFDNLSCTRYENETLLATGGKVLAQGLTFTGSVAVPVVLENEGVYRFMMRDVLSNPVRVKEGARGPYWGDIHLHTKLSHDAQGTRPYEYAREVSGLDFAAVTDHWDSLGEEGYRQVLEWARAAYIPGKFVTLLADERNPEHFTGDHNLYLRDEEHFLPYAARRENPPFSDPHAGCRLQAAVDPSVAMFVPHHTGIVWRTLSGNTSVKTVVDINACDDHGLRHVMEIYSHHGQSELWDPQHVLSYEFNRMRRPERRSNVSAHGPYYAQDYWMMGRRLGVIASSDEHTAQAGRKHGGIAAVLARGLTREAIFDALRGRQCYATTGERILIEFSVDGAPMGGITRVPKGKKVALTLSVWGTATLIRVEILRFRFGLDSSFATILSESPRPETMDASFELEDDVPCDCMYYARVTQEPLDWPDMAWTSPVWLDTDDRSDENRGMTIQVETK
jgi:hypothetical protein